MTSRAFKALVPLAAVKTWKRLSFSNIPSLRTTGIAAHHYRYLPAKSLCALRAARLEVSSSVRARGKLTSNEMLTPPFSHNPDANTQESLTLLLQYRSA